MTINDRRNSGDRRTADIRIRLPGKNMAAVFSGRSGNLIEIGIKNGKPWNAWPAGLIIEDKLTNQSFNDMLDDFRLSRKVYNDHAGKTIENEKNFSGAAFTARESWRMDERGLSWRIELELKAGEKDREIVVRQFIPYPKSAYGLNVWSAQSQFPAKLERLGGLRLAYGDVCYGTIIPMVSFYNDKAGLSVVKPLGAPSSKLEFCFQDYRSEGMTVEWSLLGLRRNKKTVVELLIFTHEACWRPALKRVVDMHPSYFKPSNPNVRDIEGGYLFSHPFVKESEIQSVAQSGAKWEELHAHFPFYGNYVPREPEWDNLARVLDLKNYHEFKKSGGKVSPKLIAEHIKMVHKHGLKSLLYFQSTGDGYPPYVSKHFKDSIAMGKDGKPLTAWSDQYLMNADPSTPFGREIRDMFARIFRQYPDADGIFLDQVCYGGLDVAHDDGLTMSGNKPAYMMRNCYVRNVPEITWQAQKQGKLVFANGCLDIEAQQGVDGHMAEGSSWIADVVKYACVEKPLLFLSYDFNRDPARVEEMMQKCLISGASYSLWPFPSRKVRRVLDCYRPLVELLIGRRLLLEPDPARLPTGYAGDIFYGPSGEMLITLVGRKASILSTNRIDRNLRISVKFKGMARLKRAECLGTHYRGTRRARMTKAKDRLIVSVPEHQTATVIRLMP